MARGQQHSKKEIRKPKKSALKSAAGKPQSGSASPVPLSGGSTTPPSSSNKKR